MNYKDIMKNCSDLRLELHKNVYCSPDALGRLESMLEELPFVTSVDSNTGCGRITITMNISRKDIPLPNNSSTDVIRGYIFDTLNPVFRSLIETYSDVLDVEYKTCVLEKGYHTKQLYDLVLYQTNIVQIIL